MRRLALAPAVALVLASAPADARPVSWPGGTTVIAEHDGEFTSGLVHYTPNRHYAVGLRHERNRMDDWVFTGVQVNWLARRWNLPASQANIYVKGALGQASADAGEASAAGQLWLSADWEDRRLMVMGETRLIGIEGGDRSAMSMARVGFAPYEGDYGDLHTWLFLQLHHMPEADDPLSAAAVVRFFYQTALLEAGVEEDGDLILNLQLRF